MDPLLRALRKRLALSPGSEAGVCADDVGLALSEVKALRRVHGVFLCCRSPSGASIKDTKVLHRAAGSGVLPRIEE
eukprot:7757650-Pyramimonas_sp.AAC.1